MSNIKTYSFESIDKSILNSLLIADKPFIIKNYLSKTELEKTTIENFCKTNSNISVKVRYSGKKKF